MLKWINALLGKKNEKDGNALHAGAVDLDKIKAGRYSDNNKPVQKINRWHDAEELYKAKQYKESLTAFFDYITDEKQANVSLQKAEGETFSFQITQGSKRIQCSFDGKLIVAKVQLAIMDYPGVAIMRRLLELNYNLYYSRAALSDDKTLCLLFDTELNSASPEKMYYGLRELAVSGDRQDDLLISDFSTLKGTDLDNTQQLDAGERAIKYKYFKQWVTDTLKEAETLNQDSFSGAIAYMLLGMVYRIDFFFTPEGPLLAELEKIHRIYWEKKETTTLVERNRLMKLAIKKLLDITEENFAVSVYNATYTFSASTPPAADKVRDHIISPNKDANWYIENKYPNIAIDLTEYGVLYNQFIYSMPKVQTSLTKILMGVIHSDYYGELWPDVHFYDKEQKKLNKELIEQTTNKALEEFKDKYEFMRWDSERVRYTSLFDFSISYSEQIANLNLKTKRAK
jgi:hypothetical protein